MNPFEEKQPGGGIGTLTEVETETRPETSTGDGDHDRFAHYVRKEKIIESAISGKPVRALCGKKWVPGYDPDRYPVCPECKAIYNGLPGGDNPSDSE